MKEQIVEVDVKTLPKAKRIEFPQDWSEEEGRLMIMRFTNRKPESAAAAAKDWGLENADKDLQMFVKTDNPKGDVKFLFLSQLVAACEKNGVSPTAKQGKKDIINPKIRAKFAPYKLEVFAIK